MWRTMPIRMWGATAAGEAFVTAWSEHEGDRFPASVRRANVIGTQFHPEKSQAFGLTLLQNFARWRP